jgi:FAD:protein FMN transferase
MGVAAFETRWLRRAQPLLGTLVEIGIAAGEATHHTAFDAAFTALREVQDGLSRFEPASDVARFNAMRPGDRIAIRADTLQVLAAAQALRDATDGAFDITLGSAPHGWRCEGELLHKLDGAARIDLGGIGKGHAVDRAVGALIAHGVASGWVNAGGDLRAFGDIDLPVRLRDEAGGGARSFATLRDGAFATSHFDRTTRSRIAAGASVQALRAHVSVAAPLCLWADALTKAIALSGDTSHPLLARFEARAWWH